MLRARLEQASFLLVEINNATFMRPAVSLGMTVGSFPEQQLVIEPNSLFSTRRKKTMSYKRPIHIFTLLIDQRQNTNVHFCEDAALHM